MMIYDVSKGYGYANVILADSGKLSVTDDKVHLFLRLYNGESFEDMKDNRGGYDVDESKLYRRETFHDKEIIIPFDANFTRIDDGLMRSQYIGKNIAELQQTIDSVGEKIDSMGSSICENFRVEPICGVPEIQYNYNDTGRVMTKVTLPTLKKPLDIDSILKAESTESKTAIVNSALSKANRVMQDFAFRGAEVADDVMTIRRHKIEMIKKFTLSLACLIFFFIGAPLGAIIRKGGLGMPIVISVILFIIYYIIDNFGYKQARDGRMDVWVGIWLSSGVLFPLGTFLTYKAMNDSAVFNPDAYRNFVRRILGIQEARKIERKEVVMHEVLADEATTMLNSLYDKCEAFLQKYRHRQLYTTYLSRGYDKAMLADIITTLDATVEYMSNSTQQLVLNKTMDFPIIRQSFVYTPNTNTSVGMALAIAAPIGFPLYLLGTSYQKTLKGELKTVQNVCQQLIELVADHPK